MANKRGVVLPAETRASIQAECEEALSRGMWSRRVELSIASHHGCQPAVVRRQRAVVERLWAIPITGMKFRNKNRIINLLLKAIHHPSIMRV
jgi:hypothetical protein